MIKFNLFKSSNETKSTMNQVSKRKRARIQVGLLSLIMISTLFTFPVYAEVAAPSLGAASNYGILGATTTVTEQTNVTGSLGSGGATGTAVVSGSTDIANSAYTSAFTDFNAAMTIASSLVADSTMAASDLGGQTITPGVYNFTGAVTIGSDIILNGDGVYVFQINGAYTTAADTEVQVTEGAQACNVFWVADVATIGANSTLYGTVMSKSAITVGADSIINGRVLAQTEVTANANNTNIIVPGDCVAVSTPEPVEEPVAPVEEPIQEPTPEPVVEAVCPSSTISVTLNTDGNLVIHAMLPNDAKATGTWKFDLGGKMYQAAGSEEITYTAESPPVGTYQVKTQFVPDNGGAVVDLALCAADVPTVTGGQLPDTATPWYNLLFAGMILALMGFMLWSRRSINQ